MLQAEADLGGLGGGGWLNPLNKKIDLIKKRHDLASECWKSHFQGLQF